MKALITGTSAGIGRACAELFLQRGWHVYGFDIAPASIAHAEYEHFVVDVRDRAAFPPSGGGTPSKGRCRAWASATAPGTPPRASA